MSAVLGLERGHSSEFSGTVDATNDQQLLHNTMHELQSQVAKLSQQISKMAEKSSPTQKGPVKIWFKELWADVKAVCCNPTNQDQITTQLEMRDGLDATKLGHRLLAFFAKAPMQRAAVAAALVIGCVVGYKALAAIGLTGFFVAGGVALAVAFGGLAAKNYDPTQNNARVGMDDRSSAEEQLEPMQTPSSRRSNA